MKRRSLSSQSYPIVPTLVGELILHTDSVQVISLMGILLGNTHFTNNRGHTHQYY